MDVTKRIERSLKAVFIAIVALLPLVFIGCGVNKSSSTPNAFLCNPASGDQANYMTQVFASFNANGCLVCHGNQPPESPQKTRFRLNADSDIATNIAKQTEDLCVTYMFGQLSPGNELIAHPQDNKHFGGQFSSSQMSQIINWVRSYRLPPINP